MTTTPAKFTTREVYESAENGSFEFCDWDISRVPEYDYEGLFSGLGNVIYKKVQRARFSIDLWHTIHTTRGSVSDADRWVCTGSVAERVHRYPRRLLKILVRTLPRTKALTSLEIDGIPFSRDAVSQLLRAVPTSPTVQSLVISRVPIPNASISEFLGAGAPYTLRDVSLIKCELAPQVASNAVHFIQTAPRTSVGRPWILKTLDLSDNDIDAATQTQIDQLLYSKMAPPAVQARTADVPAIIEEEEEESEVDRRREASLEAGRVLQGRVALVKAAESTDDPYQENGNLRRELAELLEAVHAVAVHDDVYLIGPSAADAAKLIALCEWRVHEIPA